MTDEARDIVDWAHFEKSRTELGPGFIRILAYFKEDGVKSIAEIETGDARPEYDRARASGAHAQGRIAPAWRRAGGEDRRADRDHRAFLRRIATASPTSWCPRWSSFAALFSETVEQFEKATNPLMTRAPAGPSGFGRKINNQGFGRI